MADRPTILVNGEWLDVPDHRDVVNPADGTLVGQIGYAGAEVANAAADAAAAAFPEWADLPARARADILLDAAERIASRADELGSLLAREAGKRKSEAIGEINFSAEYFRWFAEEARRPAGSVHPHEAENRRHVTIRRPVGVAATLTPWNFPCSIQARKLAPALAAGCTVVARVSEQAPLAVTELIRCLTDAGMPPGTINLVHGPAAEITGAYLEHHAVRAVSFTGSTPVGRGIMEKASRRVVRPLLELGGNASFVVFEDADIDDAVAGAMLAKFRNTGQSCIAANRFFVHSSVFDAFVERFAAAVDAMTLGDGSSSPVPDLASCIDSKRVAAVTNLVDEAIGLGARKVTREFDVPSGAFCPPALLTDVPDGAGLATEEVFGPAAAIHRFEDEAEVLARANDTEMGLAGYFYSRDNARIWRFAEQLDVGIVGINNPLPSVAFAPMGGTKQSGLGREGASDGLAEFENSRYLAIGV